MRDRLRRSFILRDKKVDPAFSQAAGRCIYKSVDPETPEKPPRASSLLKNLSVPSDILGYTIRVFLILGEAPGSRFLPFPFPGGFRPSPGVLSSFSRQ